jgi:hypothetical protein
MGGRNWMLLSVPLFLLSFVVHHFAFSLAFTRTNHGTWRDSRNEFMTSLSRESVLNQKDIRMRCCCCCILSCWYGYESVMVGASWGKDLDKRSFFHWGIRNWWCVRGGALNGPERIRGWMDGCIAQRGMYQLTRLSRRRFGVRGTACDLFTLSIL